MVVNTVIAKTGPIDAVESLRAEGRLEEALALLAECDTADRRVSALRGEIEFLLRRYHEAALSFTALVTAEPASVDGHYNLGLALLRMGRWEGAASEFQKALRLDRHHQDALIGLGISLLEQRKPQEALTAFEHCRARGNDGNAAFGRAVALQLSGRLEEARAVFDGLLERDPVQREVISNLVALTAEAGDTGALEGYARMLLALDPRSVAALQGLATVAFLQKDHRSAARYCDQLMEVAPGCIEASHNFGVATEKLLAELRGSGTLAHSAAGRV